MGKGLWLHVCSLGQIGEEFICKWDLPRFLRRGVFIWVYRLLFAPAALLALPKFVLHVRRRGGYRENWRTRFGIGLQLPVKAVGCRRVWIQAVSMGEVLAIEPFIIKLARIARLEIFLTVTTSTGYAEAKKRYGELTVGISYFPVDFWLVSKRVWDVVQPDLAISAETELWPEHLQQAKSRNVPFLLVNGRLSDRSYRATQAVAWLARGSLLKISRVFACSEVDQARFVELGVPADRVECTGNMKVDVVVDSILDDREKRELRSSLGLGSGFVLLGSSTWPGEEAMLVEAFWKLRVNKPAARLLIVPRHGERREEIERMLVKRAGSFSWHFKSRGLPEGDVDILVADTHGELRVLSQVADLAYIGRSLFPHKEGQTPVECGALGIPMVMGSGMSNFRSIRAGLRRFGALAQAADADALIALILKLSSDENRRYSMGSAGKAWHEKSRGAVECTVAGIVQWL